MNFNKIQEKMATNIQNKLCILKKYEKSMEFSIVLELYNNYPNINIENLMGYSLFSLKQIKKNKLEYLQGHINYLDLEYLFDFNYNTKCVAGFEKIKELEKPINEWVNVVLTHLEDLKNHKLFGIVDDEKQFELYEEIQKKWENNMRSSNYKSIYKKLLVRSITNNKYNTSLQYVFSPIKLYWTELFNIHNIIKHKYFEGTNEPCLINTININGKINSMVRKLNQKMDGVDYTGWTYREIEQLYLITQQTLYI